MLLLATIIIIFGVTSLCYNNNYVNKDQYIKNRNELINVDRSRSLGYDIMLTERELEANNIIMTIKHEEMDRGFVDPHNYTPSHHIFNRFDQISNSKLFQILKKLPKGGILHTHDGELLNSQFFVEITYRDNVWECRNSSTSSFLKFSLLQPVVEPNCKWLSVKDERDRLGNKTYDSLIIKNFDFYTENPYVEYPNNDVAWVKFFQIFKSYEGLLSYRPVWEEYFRKALKGILADGVQYVEIRGYPLKVGLIIN